MGRLDVASLTHDIANLSQHDAQLLLQSSRELAVAIVNVVDALEKAGKPTSPEKRDALELARLVAECARAFLKGTDGMSR